MLKDEQLLTCILLDDASSSAHQPTSRLYKNPIEYLEAHHADDLDATLEKIQDAISNQQYVVTCLSYELGEYLHGLTPKASKTPWIRAWIFNGVSKLSKDETDDWISTNTNVSTEDLPYSISHLHSNIDPLTFKKKIEQIQELIKSGDTYQVNFTYRLKGHICDDPLRLYGQLRQQQPGPFGAYIQHQDGWILSCSPEWFLAKRGTHLITKPMKGTAKASEGNTQTLEADPKNRAENLMIVDLLRNDLGRIAIPGTVSVPELFHVDQHGDVLQMTSTIEATVNSSLNLKDLLTAIYPCGSITGAPKKRTMEIIQELEDSPRELYCGSIAWFDPAAEGEILGDVGMSVVIRTLQVNQDKNFTMGVGGGITIDSNSQSEWQECQTKAHFLMKLQPPVDLFETIRVEMGQACFVDLHLERLKHSAMTFGIHFDSLKAAQLIQESCSTLGNEVKRTLHRLRLDLSQNGQMGVRLSPVQAIDSPSPLIWAKDLFQEDVTSLSGNTWLQHKLSQRMMYDQAWQRAEKNGAFDALFINELGHVTEGGRSNIFIKKDGQWLTPPISAGCLPGIMRSLILKDPQWQAIEKNFTPEDVMMAEEIILCNALRGIITIKLDRKD